ncbi:nose resistant to fluoxetine protein 6-like isoform X2 [Ornithodoros turicata]|uniref:nose resistant to fluoxetine protein 6-like isoform X2 n=1 Tax=Ornithodoros turicata TaxID=34597 RepID=UPI0031390AB9
MMVVLGFVYLIPLMMSGPLLDDIWSGFDKSCNHVWWWVATMTHNYQHVVPEYCMPHYWYVSVDFQLIIGASLLLTVLPRWPKQSLWFAGAVTVASALYTVIHTYVGGYYPTALVISTDIQKLFDTADNIYMKPYSHAGPVAVGIIFGWLAVQRHKLSRLVQAACWAVATAVGLTCLFSIWSWNHNWNPTGWGPILYGGLHRTAWALVVNWLLYVCVTGRGGPVGRLLEWAPFYPLGRLSFGLYLVHVVVLGCNIMSMRDRKSEQGFLQIQYFIGAAAMSYIFAYILYVTIEAPIAHLDNLLFGFTKRYKKENQSEGSQQVHSQCNGNHREVFVLTDSKPQ